MDAPQPVETLGVVVGDDFDGAADLADTALADASLVTGDASEVVAAEPDAVVAVGEPALHALVRERVAAPVLTVGDPPGVPAVAHDDLAAAAGRLVAGDWTTRDRRLLAATVDGRVEPALADAMVVTERAAAISEYSVTSDGDATQFRADGVVVASPTGSHGYARSAGGPVLAPATDAVAVVPVAPFTTDRRHWVLDPPVTLAVERDESAVSLLVDDHDHGSVPAGGTVTVDWGDSLSLAVVAESRAVSTLE